MDHEVHPNDFTSVELVPSSTVVYGILALYVIYQALLYFDIPILSPVEILWNALVYLTPSLLLLDATERRELQANYDNNKAMLSQTHAAKSEALRKVFGVGWSSTLTHKLSGGEGIMSKMSIFHSSDAAPTVDAPPGLGNWDNSCYQNSVLQGLASVNSLRKYLQRPQRSSGGGSEQATSTSASLQETIGKLNDCANNGKQLWTPAKLKSMSSWQQQDAQEYFSKIMDELDKEAAKGVGSGKLANGLEDAVQGKEGYSEQTTDGVASPRNPMEGLLAQRVACTRCGFSEGLSMIPFNCLTVPLGSNFEYEIESCLDEYMKLEEISEVDCAKCTLLRAEQQLHQMLPIADYARDTEKEERAQPSTENKLLSLPPEVRAQAMKRLQSIRQALDSDDFADKTLNEVCQIPKRAHVSSTKTRQAVVGRAPQSLVVHVNRSVFDELTGVQRKNYANVRYPIMLDLQTWMLGSESSKSATQNMLAGSALGGGGCDYRLRAVVTHYGRHENGHYICYRRHPTRQQSDERASKETVSERWWRLSDEDVSAVTEEDVLGQGGVFMLFYEREEIPRPPTTNEVEPVAAMPTHVEAASPSLPSGSHDVDLEPEPLSAEPQAPTSATPDDYSPSTARKDTALLPAAKATSPSFTNNHDSASEPISARVDAAGAIPPSQLSEDNNAEPEQPQAPDDCLPSTGTTTEDESEVTDAEELSPVRPVQKQPTPSLTMRTSRSRQASTEFGNAFRAVAAT